MKSGSPSRTTAAHKTQTKIQAWSSLIFHCCHSSFNPSETPPWDSRPVSGAGVVHYQLLHRPRSVPTALVPAPLVTYPHRPSQAGGYSRACALLPPLPPLPESHGGASEGLNEEWQQWKTREDQAWNFSLCFVCGSRELQLVNPPATAKAPLRPLPLMEVPFERIGMDLIGPLERSARGYRFALVLVDYATRYPEAVPLRSISAKSVAEALFRIISRVGIPKEILTDPGHGTNVTQWIYTGRRKREPANI